MKNNLLPIRIGDREYPTTEHYILSCLLKDKLYKDILLSYPVDKIQHIFNYYDQEQYTKVVYDACNKFNEKKCRSIQHKGDKTIGSLARQMIKSHYDFLFVAGVDVPLRSVVGLEETDNMLFGYNILGHSLLRIKYILEKLPDLSDQMTEYIFWKSHPEHAVEIKNAKTYKTIFPSKKKKKPITTTGYNDDPVDYFSYQEPNDDDHDEEDREEGFIPDQGVPLYSNDRVRWIATNMNSRLDDLRDIGARADFLYNTETTLEDPFYLSQETELYSKVNPMSVFKIYKAAEHLVDKMKNGVDIKAFLNKSVDAILWESKIAPELFGADPKTLDARQRYMIYTEYWDKFISKTISHYHFIEKEILYPYNLAGFIRKEYATDLNERVGQKIKEVLFSSFIYQVMEKSYPHVAPSLKMIIMNREMKKFTAQEYEDITNKLYHLFFQKKFNMDEEGMRRVIVLESYRLTTDEIEDAIRFVPIKNNLTPSINIHDTILDPMTTVDLNMDGKTFHDLFQYIFYRLYIFYGEMKHQEAYNLLFHNGKMLNGKDPRLSETLAGIVQEKKTKYTQQAIQAQYRDYPHVREFFLYSKANGQIGDDVVYKPYDLKLMQWVVSFIPKDDLHFEKSAHLYSFIHDMIRSMKIMRSITGKKLQGKSLDLFFQCFYHKLQKIASGIKVSKKIPQEFISLMEGAKIITDTGIQSLWRILYPFLYLFQQDKFIPSKLFQEIKKQYPSTNKQDMVNTLSKIVKCLYQEKQAPNDHFYLLVQMISGRDDIPNWPDPSFELVMDIEEGDTYHPLADLPEKIRKKLRKKTKKPKMEIVPYNIIHSSFETNTALLKDAFGTPSMASRASYALAALEKEMTHPRRIVFYM